MVNCTALGYAMPSANKLCTIVTFYCVCQFFEARRCCADMSPCACLRFSARLTESDDTCPQEDVASGRNSTCVIRLQHVHSHCIVTSYCDIRLQHFDSHCIVTSFTDLHGRGWSSVVFFRAGPRARARRVHDIHVYVWEVGVCWQEQQVGGGEAFQERPGSHLLEGHHGAFQQVQ